MTRLPSEQVRRVGTSGRPRRDAAEGQNALSNMRGMMSISETDACLVVVKATWPRVPHQACSWHSIEVGTNITDAANLSPTTSTAARSVRVNESKNQVVEPAAGVQQVTVAPTTTSTAADLKEVLSEAGNMLKALSASQLKATKVDNRVAEVKECKMTDENVDASEEIRAYWFAGLGSQPPIAAKHRG